MHERFDSTDGRSTIRTSSRRLLAGLVLVTLVLPIPGCTDRGTGESLPALLRIGILPDENRHRLFERYEPLRAYLSTTLDVRSVLVIPETYDALVDAVGAARVDLVYLGGLTFVRARKAHQAVPLVMRDIDARFTSYFVGRADGPAGGIDAFEDSTLTFGSRLSTSGHLMPRHFLLARDIEPESFFDEVRYSGTHDRSIEWVLDGTASLAAVNPSIFRSLVDSGTVNRSELRIVWETPPYSNYVWSARSGLSATARQRLRDAFLALTPTSEEHREILRAVDAGGFLPADARAFSSLETIASRLELLQ